MKDRMAMEKMRCTLDSIQICRLDIDEMLQQQSRLCLESLSRMATLVDLSLSISSAKRRKGSTRTFKTSVKENCLDVNDWENCFTGGSMDCGVEQNSGKRHAKCRRKPLTDRTVVNNASSLDPLTGTGKVDVGGVDEAVIPLMDRTVVNNSSSLDPLIGTGTGKVDVGGVDEAVINEVQEKELSISCKAGNEDTSIPAQRMIESADLVAPVLTRARAKILGNAGGKATMAAEGPPPKKRRARKGTTTAMSSLPAEKDENAGKMETIGVIDSQSVITKEDREAVVKLEDAETLESLSLVDGRSRQSPPKRSLRLKRNGRGTLHSLAETQGNEGKDKAIGAVLGSGDEHGKEAAKLENVASIVPHNAVEKDIDEAPPCKKSRTPSASSGDGQAFVEHHIREGPPAKKSRSRNGNRNAGAVCNALVELDRSADIIETVVAREVDSHCPLVDQDTMESTAFESNGKDQGKVHGSTDVPSERLVDAEHSGGKLLLAEPPADNAADTGHKPSTLDKDKELIVSTSTPERYGKTLAEQESDGVVADHPELKGQESNCIFVVPAEGCVGQEDRLSLKNSGLSEGNPKEFSNSLAETGENGDGTQRIVAQSLGVHRPAEEFEKLQTLVNAIGCEPVDVHSQPRDEIVEKREGAPLILGGNCWEDLEKKGTAVAALVAEYVEGSAVKQVRNEMVERRQGMPLASDGNVLEELQKRGAMMDVIGADYLVDGLSSEVKQVRNEIVQATQRMPLVLIGKSLEELEERGTAIASDAAEYIDGHSSAGSMPLVSAGHLEQLEQRGTGMDATGTEYVDPHSSTVKQVRNDVVETRQGMRLMLGGNSLEVEKRQTVMDAIGAENVDGHSSALKQGMPVELCGNLVEEIEKTGFAMDAIGGEYVGVHSSAAKQARNELVETRQRTTLVLGGNMSEELKKSEIVTDTVGAEYVGVHSPAVKQVRNEIEEMRERMPLVSLKVSCFCRSLDCDVAIPSQQVDHGEGYDNPGLAVERLEVVAPAGGKSLTDQLPFNQTTNRDCAANQVRRDEHVTRSSKTPQVHTEEPVDVELGASVPGSLQLKTYESNYCVGTSPVEHIRGRLSRTQPGGCTVLCDGATSISSEQLDDKSQGKGQLMASQASDVNVSVPEDGEETAGLLENRQMEVSQRVAALQCTVERQDRDGPLATSGHTVLDTGLSSLTKSDTASDHPQDWVNLSSGVDSKVDGCRKPDSGYPEDLELFSCNFLPNRLSGKEGSVGSPIKAGKELIQTTASSQGPGELPFENEGGTVVANGVDLDYEKKYDLLQKAAKPGTQNEQVQDAQAGSYSDSETKEKVLPQLRCNSRLKVAGSATNRHMLNMTCDWGNVRTPQLMSKYVKDHLIRGKRASNLDVLLEKRVDEVKGNSIQVSKSCSRLPPFAKLSASQMLACVMDVRNLNVSLHLQNGKDESECNRSFLQDRPKENGPCSGGVCPMILAVPSATDELSADGQHDKRTDLSLDPRNDRNKERCFSPAQEKLGGSCKEFDESEVFNESHCSFVVGESYAYRAEFSLKTLPRANHCPGVVKDVIPVSPQCRPREVATNLSSHEPEAREELQIDPTTDWHQVGHLTSILSKGPKTSNVSSIQVQDEYRHTMSYFQSPQVVKECLQVVSNVCKVSAERGCRRRDKSSSKEEINMINPIPLSRVQQVLADCSLAHRPEDEVVAHDPPVMPIGGVNLVQQAVSSNIGNAQVQSSNLVTAMKTFVPVAQRPLPSYLPTGKRDVKVKALKAAEDVKCRQEKWEMERQKRMMTRSDDGNAIYGLEKERENVDANLLQRESVEASKFDAERAGDSLPSVDKSAVSDCSNSKRLVDPVAKLKRATASKVRIEKKVKKYEEEIRRKEEEMRKKDAKFMAWKQNRDQLAKEEREKKRQKQENLLKQRKAEEVKLRAQQEEQRQRALEEAEREKKATLEEIKHQQRALNLKHTEREHLMREELETKSARTRQGEMQAGCQRREEDEMQAGCQRREEVEEKDQTVGEGLLLVANSMVAGLGQQPRDSNLLGSGSSLSSRSAIQVPVLSTEKQIQVTVASTIPSKVSCPSSSTRLLSLNAGLATGGPNKLAPTSSQHHGESDSGISCLETPSPEAAVREEDMGPISYEISPYRESSDDEDAVIAKHIPFWARTDNLKPQLLKQIRLDPDEIFAGAKTCSLKDVFGTTGSKRVQDFGKRSGSGDWVKDRVSWKEELQYKIDMGYMQKKY